MPEDVGPHGYICEAVGEYYRKVNDAQDHTVGYMLETNYEGHDVTALFRQSGGVFKWSVRVDGETSKGEARSAHTAVAEIDDILRIVLP